MHGKHLIDFVRHVAELAACALDVLCFFAKAPKHRKANVTATGRIEFSPNLRATVAWLIMVAYFACHVPLEFSIMGGNLSSRVNAVCFAFIAVGLVLLAPFPANIVIDSEGLQQRFWTSKNKWIRWQDIVEINTGETRHTVTITGADGTKIVHSRQLPDRQRLLWELKQHCGEELPADFPREPISSS